MTRNRVANWLLLISGLFFLVGCVNFITPQQGAIAKIEDRISLDAATAGENVFLNKDVQLLYSLFEKGETIRFNGKLVFGSGLTGSFPVIRTLFFKMSFLDAEGAVVQTVDITPQGALGTINSMLTIKKDFLLPSEAKQIVFNYYGIFINTDEVGNDWEIFYYPFER